MRWRIASTRYCRVHEHTRRRCHPTPHQGAGRRQARTTLAELGSLEHISQQRFYYVDVKADGESHALEQARRTASQDARIDLEKIVVTTPGAPLDQPNSLPT